MDSSDTRLRDMIFEYEQLLLSLRDLLRNENESVGRRDRLKIAVLEEEIRDIEFAIVEMRKSLSGYCGYSPHRNTIHRRPGLYLCDRLRGI